ncbi:MAG: NADH-quinone oxidoreductase subunit C [Thermodesulfovibrio sp.]|nr:NADH-quinone oxidoreductase subunit C [Thermodesulfovibrio sp.]
MAQEIENTLKIAEKVKSLFPEDVFEIKEYRKQVSIITKKEKVKEILKYLKEQEGFNHLQDLCGVDYYPEEPRFEVVYNLYSILRRLSIRVRAKVFEEEPYIDTVTDLWQGADWHERECFDMFGIIFKNHPDLRRILMPEDWNGYPLRKDYPLRGKELWKGFKEIVDPSICHPERSEGSHFGEGAQLSCPSFNRDSSGHLTLRNDNRGKM